MPRPLRRPRSLLSTALAFLLGSGACGGDGEDAVVVDRSGAPSATLFPDAGAAPARPGEREPAQPGGDEDEPPPEVDANRPDGTVPRGDTTADAGRDASVSADAGRPAPPDAAVDAGARDAGSLAADGGRPEETRFCGRIRCDCQLKGIRLWGKVQVVDAFADFKVREASFPDLRVAKTSFPDSCGEWQLVDAFGDFKIQWVTAFEDFSIEYGSFPGLAQTAR